VGAGLLAAASLSDGTLVGPGTAARTIGWLFVVATVVGVGSLRRGDFRQLGAAALTFASALTVLYLSYAQWGEAPSAPIRHAVAEPLPAMPVLPVVYKVIEPEVLPVANKKIPAAVKVAAPVPAREPCSAESGLAWIVCREKARLQYCEGREGDEATCASAIPFSPPG
jgi:hypothetical protein